MLGEAKLPKTRTGMSSAQKSVVLRTLPTSAELAGDRAAAQRHYADLVAIAAPTRETRPERIAAKAFVDRR